MKEDILEQVVDDWFLSKKGVFTKHNVKFRPDKNDPDYIRQKDSSYSDIDVLAYDTRASGYNRVSVVTCKSWQSGFNPEKWIKNLREDSHVSFSRRSPWKYFRELVIPKWTKAFVNVIRNETGESTFTYYVVCTRLYGRSDREVFENNQAFIDAFKEAGSDVQIRVKTFKELFSSYFEKVANNPRTTLEATEVGRLLQLIKASGALETDTDTGSDR